MFQLHERAQLWPEAACRRYDAGVMFTRRIDPDLELRLLEPRHASELFAVIDANRDHLRKWLAWVDSTHTVHSTRGFIQACLLRFAEQETVLLGIWTNGRMAGVIEGRIDSLNNCMDIGYWLAQRETHKGIMTRACAELVRYALQDLKLVRVQIRCAVENCASWRVAERVGFEFEGVSKKALRLSDQSYIDARVYGMTMERWAEFHHAPPEQS